jgi:hypothetical protein
MGHSSDERMLFFVQPYSTVFITSDSTASAKFLCKSTTYKRFISYPAI